MAIIFGTNLRNKLTGTNAVDTIFGLSGNDILDGNNGNDILRGGLGNDTLIGGAGSDKLYGEGGDDTLRGDAGADRFDGGSGTDTVTYAAVTGATGATMSLDGSAGSAGAAAGDSFFAIENIIGSKENDSITGNNRANILTGGAGNDSLAGQGGADRLLGGDGDDTLVPGADTAADIVAGGEGTDGVMYLTSTTGVIIDLEMGTTGGGAINDVLSSIEIVAGSLIAGDTITVNRGGLASGAGGDDVLSGSTATGGINPLTTEILQGGTGADTFVLHADTGYDFIGDFSYTENDKFRVSTAEFGTSSAANIVNLSGTIAPTVAAPQFIYDTLGHNLYFDGDGTGSAHAPLLIAYLYGFTDPLSNVDFVFVA